MNILKKATKLMSILKIIKYGEPSLRTETKSIQKITSKIHKLISDMIETMYAYDGVGLAAPQVGKNYKLFIIDVFQDENRKNPIVFINPKIIKKSGEAFCDEGCLSLPDIYAEVKRYSDVTVKAIDQNGKEFILEAKDGSLLSRAIQHENDHLNGFLFIDRVTDIENIQSQLKEYGLPSIDKKYTIKNK